MDTLNKIPENKNSNKKFIEDPFHSIVIGIIDPIYFNVKIPKGENNLLKQPKSANKVKQEKK